MVQIDMKNPLGWGNIEDFSKWQSLEIERLEQRAQETEDELQKFKRVSLHLLNHIENNYSKKTPKDLIVDTIEGPFRKDEFLFLWDYLCGVPYARREIDRMFLEEIVACGSAIALITLVDHVEGPLDICITANDLAEHFTSDTTFLFLNCMADFMDTGELQTHANDKLLWAMFLHILESDVLNSEHIIQFSDRISQIFVCCNTNGITADLVCTIYPTMDSYVLEYLLIEKQWSIPYDRLLWHMLHSHGGCCLDVEKGTSLYYLIVEKGTTLHSLDTAAHELVRGPNGQQRLNVALTYCLVDRDLITKEVLTDILRYNDYYNVLSVIIPFYPEIDWIQLIISIGRPNLKTSTLQRIFDSLPISVLGRYLLEKSLLEDPLLRDLIVKTCSNRKTKQEDV